MKHFVNITLLIIVFTVLLLFAVNAIDWMPTAASAEAKTVDWLFGLHLNVIAFLYVLVNGILLYSVFVFRRKKGDDSEGAYFHGNTSLEIAWTIIPLATVLFFAFLGAQTLKAVSAPAEDEITVEVTARQWSWSFKYPDLGEWNADYAGESIGSTELYLPVDRKVNLILTSEDVTHNFWVPEFRLKQDTVPGKINHLRITPTELGTYKLRCAELCGTSHAFMLANINVVRPDEFDAWVQKRLGIYVPAEGEAGGGEVDPVALGAEVARNAGCVACHSPDGSEMVGPTWQGLLGRTEALEDGSSIVVDEEYIRESILNPRAKIVAGYTDLMPDNYGDVLTPEELEALIAYISSL